MNLERPIIPSKSEIAKTASTPTSKSKRSSASFSALHYNNNSHQFHMDSPSSPSPRRLPLRINDMLRESTASYSDTDRGNEPEKESSDSSLKSKSTRQNALANRGKPNIADANDTKVKTKASVQTGDVSTQKQAASYNSDSNLANDDLILAVTALGKMKSDSQSSLRSPSPPAPQLTASRNMPKPPTIFDKMISHPIISNSINYVLEKTINNSATNIPAPNSLPVGNSASTGGLINDDSNNKKRRRSPTVENEPNQKDVPYTGVNKRFKPRNLQIPESHFMTNTNLRQRVAITSAMSAQKSLEELKHLSTLNFNIESRKKLTMLIHFLRLGNSQLSERIDKLIQSVDAKREKIGAKSTASDGQSNAESDLSIQEIKADIVTTVKKIVNVVSKVSAQSLSEPARSNVREALLKLPTNWATMLNNESVFSLGIHEEDDEEEEEEDEEEEDEDEEDDGNDVNYDNHALAENDDKGLHQNNKNGGDAQGVSSEENIPTMTVNNKTIFKRTRKPSISQRLITSLLRYRKTKGDKIDKNKSKLRKWFREKIRDQLMHDSSGKVLILAQESLDMINKIITFCNESLDKADHWNTDKQKHHQFELLKRLQNMNSLSPNVEKVETIVVKDSRVDCSQDAVDSPKEDKPVTRP